MKQEPPSCVVVGALCEDVVRSPDATRKGIGGTAYYFSAAFSALGGRAGCVTKAHEDWVLAQLDEANIGTAGLGRGTTCSFELLYEGDLRSLRLLRHSSKIEALDIPTRYLGFDGLHLGPVEDELDASIWNLRESFPFISLDIQGLARTFDLETGEVTISKDMGEQIRSALACVDVVKFSHREAESLLGLRATWEEATSKVRELGPSTVIITMGDQGALVFEDGRSFRIPVYPSAPVDWTGAGDCFMAGFHFRRLLGHDSMDAANFGSALAAIVIERQRPLAFPRTEEVLDKMSSRHHC